MLTSGKIRSHFVGRAPPIFLSAPLTLRNRQQLRVFSSATSSAATDNGSSVSTSMGGNKRAALQEAFQLREQLVATSPTFLQDTAVADTALPPTASFNYNFSETFHREQNKQQQQKGKSGSSSNFDAKILNKVVAACRTTTQRRGAVSDYDMASSHLLTTIADTFSHQSHGPGKLLEGRRLDNLDPLSTADEAAIEKDSTEEEDVAYGGDIAGDDATERVNEKKKSGAVGIDGVSFQRADLRGSQLCSYNSFTNCRFDMIDGRGAVFAGSEFRWCSFTAAALERAEFCNRNAEANGGDIQGCYFAHCKFDRAALVGANLRGCTFYACDFSLCDLTKAIIDKSTMFQGPEGWSICRRGAWALHGSSTSSGGAAGPKVVLQGGVGNGLPPRAGTNGLPVGVGVLP